MSEYGNPHQDEPGGTYENSPLMPGMEYMYHPHASVGTSNELLVNAEYPDVVVKAANLDSHYGNFDRATPEADTAHAAEQEALCKQAKELYQELEEQYGLNIPKFMYVIGDARYGHGIGNGVQRVNRNMSGGGEGEKHVREKGDTEPIFYTVSEKIIGVPLNHVDWDDRAGGAPTEEQYEQLFTVMTRYLVDKCISKQPFYGDFGFGIRMDEQFMLGHIKKSTDEPQTTYENMIYLHDIDPKFWQPGQKEDPAEDEAHRQEQLREMLTTLLDNLAFAGEVTNNTFESTLSIIEQEVRRLDSQYPELSAQVLQALNNERRKLQK